MYAPILKVTKTCTCQCTRAGWSTFADIHSTQCIDALFGVTGISGYLQHTQGVPNLSYDCNL